MDAPDPDHAEALNQEIDFFAGQMARLRAAGAIPVGYVDRPSSAYVLRILELIDLPIEKITRESLRQGPFIQLTDRQLFADLAPNERTGLFEPNSDANDRYRVRSDGDRIAFAYANVARQPGAAERAPSPASRCRAGSRPTRPSWIWPRPPSTPTASRPATPTSWPAPTSWRSSAARRRKIWSRCCSRPCCATG